MDLDYSQRWGVDNWHIYALLFSLIDLIQYVMREMQENYYLILFMFASQLYFYVLGSISLLGF